jgi:F-type H+-transporting ATPase subunit delta
MVHPHDHTLIRRLARILVDAGEDSADQFREVLPKMLGGKSSAEKRQFLRLLRKAVRRELHRNTLLIESPGSLGEEVRDQLVQAFTSQHEQRLYVREKENPALIGGLRVRLGDTVYDASVGGRLEALAAGIH